MSINIQENENSKIFFIETKKTMYEMKVDEFRVLKHIWYGKKTSMDRKI